MLVALFQPDYDLCAPRGNVLRTMRIIPPTTPHFYAIPFWLARLIETDLQQFEQVGELVHAGYLLAR